YAAGLVKGRNNDRNQRPDTSFRRDKACPHCGFRCLHKRRYCIIRSLASTFSMTDRLLRACKRQPVVRTPVWMMRQAGRYLPEYRAIRQKVSFLELCKNTDLAAEVSLQPYRILGVDAVIFFSDILIPVEAMGVGVELTDKGPEIASPIRAARDVDALRIPDPAMEVPFVGSIIKKLR